MKVYAMKTSKETQRIVKMVERNLSAEILSVNDRVTDDRGPTVQERRPRGRLLGEIFPEGLWNLNQTVFQTARS